MTPLERITERVMRGGHPDDEDTPRPLLTLAEFFDGNDVIGSIGCNLAAAPTPAEFRQVLEDIAARPEVVDVRVQISMFDNPEWPFSDMVWIMTSAAPDEVAGWFPEDFAPDDVCEGWDDDTVYEDYDVPPGTKPLGCWWD